MHRRYVHDRCFHPTQARSTREGNSNTVHKIYSAARLATNVSISCHIPQLRNPISSRRSTNISFIRLTAQIVMPKILILVINQPNAQILVLIIRFIICRYMFRALCAHHQEVEIVLYSIWYHHTCRCCIIQF